MKTLVLMGMKHCGKSTLARLVAEKNKLKFFDTDDVMFDMTGKTPREILSEGGAESFYAAEKNACQKVVDEINALSDKCAVVATGGGICNNKEAVELLKTAGVLVYLNVRKNVVTHRVVREIKVGKDGSLSNMPAYIAKKNPRTIKEARKIFSDFFDERSKIYKEISNVTVNASYSKKKNAAILSELLHS